jgi:molybdopterin synthase catalytic subunit
VSAAALAIVQERLSIDPLVVSLEAEARAIGEGCGAICTFAGIVRATHHGRAVRYLEYEAHETLAVKTFGLIAAEVATEWPRSATRDPPSESAGWRSVRRACSWRLRPRIRAEAFHVCRYAIERVKQIAPVWKHEFFEDGDAWVEGAVADPQDVAAREQARARACA